MIPTSKISLLVCVSCLLVTAIGCGPQGAFPTAQVEGTVKTEDGTPIESGKIKFAPTPSGDAKAKAGKPAIGRIKDGSFTLTTYGNGDGAVVGQHTVSINEAKIGERSFVIAPASETVQVTDGDNVFELKAIPRKRRRGVEDEEDDD